MNTNLINTQYINSDLLKQFESYCKLTLTDMTIHNYLYGLSIFQKYLHIPISQLKKNNIIEIYTNIIKDYSKNIAYIVKSSIKKYFDFLNDIYNLELNNNILNIKMQGWVLKQKLPAISSDKTLEIIKAIEKLNNSFSNKRNILTILILATTGIRRKELLSIQLSDIDLINNTIFIRNPKGEKKARTVLIADIVKEKLQSYLIARDKIAEYDNENLLITIKGKKITIYSFANIFRNLSKRINIKFTFHSFRRGLATELYNKQNIRVSDIANILGHSSINCTVKHYIQIDNTKISDILNNHNLYKINNKSVGYFNDIKNIINKDSINSIDNNVL